jgi:hypothetical protein
MRKGIQEAATVALLQLHKSSRHTRKKEREAVDQQGLKSLLILELYRMMHMQE